MKDTLLTIQQAATLLGVSTRTLRRWEQKGLLKPQRTMGNQRRYSQTELETLFKKERGKLVIPAGQGSVQEPVGSINSQSPQVSSTPDVTLFAPTLSANDSSSIQTAEENKHAESPEVPFGTD